VRKVLALQLLVLPTLAATFGDRSSANGEVVDEAMVSALMKGALDTASLPR
jgi:hypothetical protein